MLPRSSRWVICEKKKVRRRKQTIQCDETYELPPPSSSVMEKGGHCRQVRRGAHAPSGQRGVDIGALLLRHGTMFVFFLSLLYYCVAYM